MKKISILVLLLPFLSCREEVEVKDNNNCAFIFCIGGTSIALQFLVDGENILDKDPDAEIIIFQNADTAMYYTDTTKQYTAVHLITDDPITISINGETAELELTSIDEDDVCCPGISVTSIKYNNTEICTNKEECSQVNSLNWEE